MAIHFGGFNLDCKVDCYGFHKPEDFNELVYREFVDSYLPILARRLKRWEKTYRRHASTNNKLTTSEILKKRFSEQQLNRFIRKGIPASLRPQVWMATSGAESIALSRPGAFEVYCCTRLSNDITSSIEIDLGRTFPDNEYFNSHNESGRLALKQVLRAIAAKRPDVGYCQGFNFVAGMLLLIFKSPEKAFWLIDTMLDRFPENFYGSDLHGLRIELSVLGRLIKERAPDIDRLFRIRDANLALLTTKWFVCWFVETIPIETVFRLWDCAFGDDGPDIFTRAAFTLIVRYRESLLRCSSFQQLVSLFQGDMIKGETAINCHLFMQDVLATNEWLSADQLKEFRRSAAADNPK